MSSNALKVCGLTQAEVQLFLDQQVTDEVDLMQLTFEDMALIIPQAPVIKKRRVANVAKFLARGGVVTASTTMVEIARLVSGDSATSATAAGGTSGTPTASDLSKGAPKTYTNFIPEFSGNPIEWEDWEIGATATIGQTQYSSLLKKAPKAGDEWQAARDKELYNAIIFAVREGTALHLVEAIASQSGHEAWKKLQSWYGSAETVRHIVNHWRGKFNELVFDENSTASEYINDFTRCNMKLEKYNEGYTADTKRRTFLEKIIHEDYTTIRDYLQNVNHGYTFEQCVTTVRSKETDLQVEASNTALAKSRRVGGEKEAKKGGGSIPMIPFWLLAKVKDSTVKSALLKWRKVYNSEHRVIRKDETSFAGGKSSNPPEKDDVSMESENHTSSKGGKTKSKGKKSKNKDGSSRRTTKDPHEVQDDDGDDEDESGEEEIQDVKKSRPTKKRKVVKVGRVVHRSPSRRYRILESEEINSDESDEKSTHPKARRNPRSRRKSSNGRVGKLVVDSGTKTSISGGIGWKKLEVVSDGDKGLSVSPWMAGEKSTTLPIVNAVTAFEDRNRIVLLGLGGAALLDYPDQEESLVNLHVMRDFNIEVDDKKKEHGGSQSLTVDGVEIPLSSFGRKDEILYVKIQEPTNTELKNLPIHWLTPRMDRSQGQYLLTSTRLTKSEDVSLVKKWEERLGNAPEFSVTKTLQATTQLCVGPVEMETRGEPRQHRKQRLLPLHPKCLSGRTDLDTFFSPIKSARGFTCAQLFVHLPSQFLYVPTMRKESNSHAAFQDFIRYVGAPNTLLTDNAQTLVGKRWTKTCRQHVIKQIASVPHNQNQNHAERKIGDVKRRVEQTLRMSRAPLEFWCYCLKFVVDCLNHTARKDLDWRTPKERIEGMTPDISMFRFSFWQPVLFFEPTIKYPKSNMLMGRFVGIAWNHGDAFTYRIWTEPEGDWTKGQELIRNIFQVRKEGDKERAVRNPSQVSWDITVRDKRTKKKRKVRHRPAINDVPVTGPMQAEETTEDPKAATEKEKRVSFDDTPLVLEEDTTQEEQGGSEEETAEEEIQPTNQNSKTLTTASTAFQTIHESDAPRYVSDDEDSDSEDEEAEETIDEDLAVESMNSVNEELGQNPDDLRQEEVRIESILAHKWVRGHLQLKVEWTTGSQSWETVPNLKEDHPFLLAKYMVENNTTRSKRVDRNMQWAKKVLRDRKRAMRRVRRLYDFVLDENNRVRAIKRKVGKGKRKKKKFSPKPVFKYGIQVPRTVREALEIDKRNGNTFWEDAIRKEMIALNEMSVFEYKEAGYKPGNGWQKTTIHVVFDVKQDLRRKARAVAGGHLVDASGIDIYSSTVKGISIKLVQVIAHKAGLKLLCGDVGNVYVNAYTKEKVFVPVAGPEFGDKEGMCVIIRKALYGLAGSCKRWHQHFSDTLQGLGFIPTRYDPDVWIRKFEDGRSYEYICTHVDDFLIASKRADIVMEKLKEVYTIKNEGPLEYYLGNDYIKRKGNRWFVGCKKYLKESIRRVEDMFGTLTKKAVPSVHGDHPELDGTKLLSDDEHQKFQMLIGMLNWIVTIGRFDVAFATMSLARFTAAPRKGHLKRALNIFGYLKKRPNRQICIDSCDPEYRNCEDAFSKDYASELSEFYPDASEELDTGCPESLVSEMKVTIFVDSDHAHDKMTHRSVTGILILVGRTPVFHYSKRQGAVECSTYGAEFMAMRTAVEEALAVCYMLRALGVKVEMPSAMFGDNLGVVQNVSVKDSLLKKKHIALSYHKTREAVAARVVHPIHMYGDFNFSDTLTKAQTQKVFSRLV